MEDYLELELFLDEDEMALLSVHLLDGGSFIIPNVTGDPVRGYGSWTVPCLSHGKPSRALIPADKVAYFTATSYADLYGRDDSEREQNPKYEVETSDVSDTHVPWCRDLDCFGCECLHENVTEVVCDDCGENYDDERGDR